MKKKKHQTILASLVLIVVAGIIAFIIWPRNNDPEEPQESVQLEAGEKQKTAEPEEGTERSSERKDDFSPSDDEIESIAVGDMDDYAPGDVIEKTLIAENIDSYFREYMIEEGGEVYERILGKSYVENDNIKLSDLRYLKMLHYNYSHEIQVGEMIVNADVSEDVLAVFKELFENEYEIESMRLIDDFWMGDGGTSDDESINHNNTSAFCYRYITRGSKLSNHAFGRAIDINPRQNPYIWYGSDGTARWSAEDAEKYIDRDSGAPHMILRDDVCYSAFAKHGFQWGGDWNNPKDYQHFEK